MMGGAHGVTLILVENGSGDPSSNPKQECILRSTNTLEKQ